MKKRLLLIITILALLFLALVFKMRSTQPAATPTMAAAPIASTPVVVLPTMKPVASSSKPSVDTTIADTEPSYEEQTRRLAAEANLSSIAKTFMAYSYASEPARIFTANPGDTAHDAARELARVSGLNSARIYFVANDPKAPNPLPKVVLISDPSEAEMNPEFVNATLSVEIAANIPPNANVKTTPVAWSRGLREDGTWTSDSPFGGKGGIVVFLDGHSKWYDRLSTSSQIDNYLVIYGTNTPTVNIREALPPGAVILSAEPNGAQR